MSPSTIVTSEGYNQHHSWMVNHPAVWCNDNYEIHRDGDLPAIIWPNGDKRWMTNGKTHRVGKPAVIKIDGTIEWWNNGRRHMVYTATGTRMVYDAAGTLMKVEYSETPVDTLEAWNRTEIDVVTTSDEDVVPDHVTVTTDADGYKEWFLNGKLHREDGPAVEWTDGSKEWYLNGEYYSESEYNAEMLKRNSLL